MKSFENDYWTAEKDEQKTSQNLWITWRNRNGIGNDTECNIPIGNDKSPSNNIVFILGASSGTGFQCIVGINFITKKDQLYNKLRAKWQKPKKWDDNEIQMTEVEKKRKRMELTVIYVIILASWAA